MERQLILDLFTGVLAVLVFSFLIVGLFLSRKCVDWDNNSETLAYLGMCAIVGVCLIAVSVQAYFWFTTHIIYIP